MALTVKLLLALCAFVIAILGLTDSKSFADTNQIENIPWHRRLTRMGYAKIGFAIATLLLGGLNEYLTNADAEAGLAKQVQLSATIRQLNEQAADQRERLDQTKNTLNSVAANLAATSRTIDLLSTGQGSQLVRLGNYRVLLSPMSGIDYAFVDKHGQKYQPNQSDKIEYSVVCRAGSPPPATACKDDGYGRLIANDDNYVIRSLVGGYVFKGTRTTGNSMTYQAPISDCALQRKQLEDAFCEVDIDVYRESKFLQLDQLKKQGYPFNSAQTDVAHDDLCRAYQILYETPCVESFPGQEDGLGLKPSK